MCVRVCVRDRLREYVSARVRACVKEFDFKIKRSNIYMSSLILTTEHSRLLSKYYPYQHGLIVQ